MESNVVDRPKDISERLLKQLQDHTEFLREELRNKNNMINCLLEQLSKRDDTVFSYKNQVYNLQQKLSYLHTAQSDSYNSVSGAQLGGWGRGRPPLPVFENQKKYPDFGRKCPDLSIFRLNLPFKV